MQVSLNPFARRLAILALALALHAVAQTRITAADYARAEKSMTYNTTPLMFGSDVRPTWLSDERFWYRKTTTAGSEFVLVDPATGTRQPAFDHAKLAWSLSVATGSVYDPNRLRAGSGFRDPHRWPGGRWRWKGRLQVSPPRGFAGKGGFKPADPFEPRSMVQKGSMT
jgi:hypothetical protein